MPHNRLEKQILYTVSRAPDADLRRDPPGVVDRTRAGAARVLVAPALGVAVAVAGCTAPAPAPGRPAPRGGAADLLLQDWRHVPGVTEVGGGLQVTATGPGILAGDDGHVSRTRRWTRPRYDWFVDDDGLQQGRDLLFDDERPTPACAAVRRALGG